jgi:hypothetical protein
MNPPDRFRAVPSTSGSDQRNLLFKIPFPAHRRANQALIRDFRGVFLRFKHAGCPAECATSGSDPHNLLFEIPFPAQRRTNQALIRDFRGVFCDLSTPAVPQNAQDFTDKPAKGSDQRNSLFEACFPI